MFLSDLPSWSAANLTTTMARLGSISFSLSLACSSSPETPSHQPTWTSDLQSLRVVKMKPHTGPEDRVVDCKCFALDYSKRKSNAESSLRGLRESIGWRQFGSCFSCSSCRGSSWIVSNSQMTWYILFSLSLWAVRFLMPMLFKTLELNIQKTPSGANFILIIKKGNIFHCKCIRKELKYCCSILGWRGSERTGYLNSFEKWNRFINIFPIVSKW